MDTEKRQSRVRKTVNKAVGKVRKAGGRLAHTVAEAPELVSLHRNDRAIRSEMDDHLRAIGKRAFALHKRARGDSPFSRFETIMRELDTLVRLDEEFRSNRVRLKQLQEEIRHRK
jgi:hypothetical protein